MFGIAKSVMTKRLVMQLAAAAGGVMAVSAHGAILNWASAVNGTASVAGSWNPAQVPVAADSLVFNATAGVQSYGVTFNASSTASSGMTYNEDTVTLTMSSPHTTSGAVSIGPNNLDIATVVLTTGTWNVGGAVTLGGSAGSNGTLTVNDDDADFLMTGATSDMIVGSNAPGTLNITGGGLVRVLDQFIAGNNSGGTSNVTISGATNVLPIVRSMLDVNGASQSRLGQGGDATVNISNGGLADFEGDLVVANGSASSSSVTIAGTGGLLPQNATLDVAGDLLLGRNTSAGISAGAATLNVNADGRAVVGGTLFVAGDPDGGTATLHTATDGFITTHSLNIGLGATLDLTGGAIDIDGGVFSWGIGGIIAINGGANSPVITMKNGATATLSNLLRIGTGAGINTIDFDIRSGADLVMTGVSGQIELGVQPDDVGRMTVSGVGSTLDLQGTVAGIAVGSVGGGRFEADQGAHVSAYDIKAGIQPGATGFALIENPGTVVDLGYVKLGDNGAFAGGNGTLVVRDQAVLNVGGFAASGITIDDVGFMEVQGAVVNAQTADIEVLSGEFSLEHGAVVHATKVIAVGAGSKILGPNGIPGSANLDASVDLRSGGSLELTNGDLTAGRVSDPAGFEAANGSVISVGSHRLTMLDANRATVDEVTINGGEIVAANGLEIVTPGTSGKLDGTGTITTSELYMESGGSVITATGANGITINGKFLCPSGMIDGTKYTFNNNPTISDSGWTGAGTINARVAFNAGTQVNALANMTMGASVTDGVTFGLPNTLLYVDTRHVTLVDNDQVMLPALTLIDGGTLTGSGCNMAIESGRTLRGNGFIVSTHPASQFQTLFGTFDPDQFFPNDPPATQWRGIGELDFTCNLFMHSGFHYQCDVQGFNGQGGPLADLLDVHGSASFSGNLDVNFIEGYQPNTCDEFTIVRYTSRTGTFSNVSLPPGITGGVRYEATRAVLFFTSVPCDSIDFNNDTSIFDPQDIDAFLSVYSEGPCIPASATCNDVDFNNDCSLFDPQDIDAFLSMYGEGPCIR